MIAISGAPLWWVVGMMSAIFAAARILLAALLLGYVI